MDQQKIDRLFREKLDNYEATPSAHAWVEVEKKIGTKRNSSKFYWVAAAISLLIISWAVWPQEPLSDSAPIASKINHPVQMESPEWTIPMIVKELKKEEKISNPKAMRLSDVLLVAQEPPAAKVIEVEKLEDVSESESKTVIATSDLNQVVNDILQSESLGQSEIAEKVTPNALKIDLSKVKITYIASRAEEKQEFDSVGVIKKFIAFAGKISPGDVLADIKTAKDDFINGGFKSKNKDRNSL